MSNDEKDEKPDPRETEQRLFAGLMRTKTLPMVPDQTPSNTPDAPAKPPQPSFADGTPGPQELKKELLVRGMSDKEAEDYFGNCNYNRSWGRGE